MRSAVAVIVAVVVVAAIAAIVAVVGFGFPTRTAATLEGTRLDPQNFAQIARGRYLVAASDCADCHDDPVTKAPFAGGRPIETPFGKVLAANITPDRDTAIGAWSDSAFVAALREGKSPHGSPLYPAMPYPYYTKLSESDALAIRAYLNTVPPVRNRVVADQLPFPLNIRQAMLLWNAVYFHPGEFKPDPSQSAEWNRGAYLVEGPGHCGACHTPKNVLGGDDNGRALRGYQLQGWFAPNITGDPVDGVGRWSADDIASYLKTGHTVTTAATGIMAEVVAFTGSKLTDSDLRAIAIYLKSLPGQSQPGPALGASDSRMKAGEAIYRDACSACHSLDGKGVAFLFPALADSANVHSENPTSLIRIVLQGARSVATDKEPTGAGMPAFGWKLDDKKIAAVLTYVRNSWGGAAAPVTGEDVRKLRSSLMNSAER